MRKLLNQTFKTYYSWRMRLIERFMEEPYEAQERQFKQLISKGRHTEWGKMHAYREIKTFSDFANRVPIRDYEYFKPFIERMMLGERDILWQGRVKWFSKSSGTTSAKSKFIPVSDENLEKCHQKGNWDAVTILYHQRPDARLFELRTLLIAGSLSKLEQHPQTQIGDISAIMVARMPRIAVPFFAPDIATATLPDFGEKLERTAQITANHQDIVSIGGVPTWVVVLFKRVLEITGKDNILEVWPNFQFYIHGGVSFLPYQAQFEQFLPSDQVSYQEVYNASEGYFAIQNDFSVKDMLLLLDNGVFYEFIPTEEWQNDFPKAIPLSEVQLGKKYALVISTNSGLWRYQPGDTVVFTSIRPYKIKISGRTKQYINTFGEEVMVENTDYAIAQACRRTGAIVLDYTAAPIYMSNGKGGHEWLIEFAHSPLSLLHFERILDEELQKCNSDYEAKRYKNMALAPLKIHTIPQGTFIDWLKFNGKYSSQAKVPRLSNHREVLEDILRFIASTLADNKL